MRIIDADELLKGKTDHEMISTHLIFNAPTVDVLDKIRADIEHWESDDTQDDYQMGAMDMQNYVLRVIDKYR